MNPPNSADACKPRIGLLMSPSSARVGTRVDHAGAIAGKHICRALDTLANLADLPHDDQRRVLSAALSIVLDEDEGEQAVAGRYEMPRWARSIRCDLRGAADHSRLVVRRDGTTAFQAHPYVLDDDRIAAVAALARERPGAVSVRGWSPYFPGDALRVEVER